ncbi:unnamed protein product [Rhizoctonia solani]|uniref:BTB domain-containing protein n=1 Tax=Rhizoctonia solani TaxID=456999 RepID=A0A8H3C3J9_9AGAM|nr:unnamed protein product [Rhizoctonia solani]
MSKRRTANDSDEAFSINHSDLAPKRARKEESVDGLEILNGRANTASHGSDGPLGNSSRKTSRDSNYYFDDGNLVFCVEGILFKVHASLLKLQSNDFEKMTGQLSFSADATPAGSKGTCDQNPIIIPNILHRQFCNLMKMIYHPFSHQRFLGPPASSASNEEIARCFGFYLDVASLSHRFAMDGIEKWVKPDLKETLHTCGKSLAAGIDGALCEERGSQCSTIEGEDEDESGNDDDNDEGESDEEEEDSSQDEDDGQGEGNDEETWNVDEYCAFLFVDAVSYAKTISDTSLLNDSLSVLQYYCVTHASLKFIIGLLRMQRLRQSNPPLFGSLFLLLLSQGNKIWSQNLFTHMDRMAFFSAQSYLTPFPKPLKTSSGALLFTRLASSRAFAKICLPADHPCNKRQCRPDLFSYWEKSFDGKYYDDVNSKEFTVVMKALASLPSRRIDFSRRIQRIKCSSECYTDVLLRLDEAIQDLHTRLAEYYKGFE